MTLRGADGLERRLRAMERSTSTYPKTWADAYVQAARPQIPVKTGKTRRSVQVRSTSPEGAEIEGSQIAVLIDTGTLAHPIEAKAGALKFQKGGQTIFARRVDHPGMRARPWRERASDEALRRHPLDETVVDAWNRAD